MTPPTGQYRPDRTPKQILEQITEVSTEAGCGRAGDQGQEAIDRTGILHAVGRAWGRAWHSEAEREAVEAAAIDLNSPESGRVA